MLSDKPSAAVAVQELAKAKDEITKAFKVMEKAKPDNYRDEFKKVPPVLACV